MTQITRDTGTEPKPRSKIFIGRVVHCKSLKHLEVLPKAALGVTRDGTISFLDDSITSVEEARAKYSTSGFGDADYITLTQTQFLFPGLIDTHLHAPQWPNLAIGMEGNLREWCENYTDPIEASYGDTAKAKRIYSDVVQTTLQLGSTTVAYNSTIHSEATNVLADMCLKYGQRAVIGKLCILIGSTRGNWEESSEQSLADSEKSIKYMRQIDPEGRLIHPCVQPRGGPYCPPDLMGGLGDLSHKYKADDGHALRVQAHMCETTSDRDRTLELHKKFDSYAEMYNGYGMLHSGSILAHCIHLSETDMNLLKETKAGVAHNPNSNTCLRDGECRVRELLEKGVKVGLGTDCSAGYMPSITDAMRSASNVSRFLAMKTGEDKWTLAFEECLYLATMGGAEVVGLEEKIGNFEVGKEFDALLVDVDGVISVGEWDGKGKEGGLALVKKWVFLGDDRHIKGVWVGGESVVG